MEMYRIIFNGTVRDRRSFAAIDTYHFHLRGSMRFYDWEWFDESMRMFIQLYPCRYAKDSVYIWGKNEYPDMIPMVHIMRIT